MVVQLQGVGLPVDGEVETALQLAQESVRVTEGMGDVGDVGELCPLVVDRPCEVVVDTVAAEGVRQCGSYENQGSRPYFLSL